MPLCCRAGTVIASTGSSRLDPCASGVDIRTGKASARVSSCASGFISSFINSEANTRAPRGIGISLTLNGRARVIKPNPDGVDFAACEFVSASLERAHATIITLSASRHHDLSLNTFVSAVSASPNFIAIGATATFMIFTRAVTSLAVCTARSVFIDKRTQSFFGYPRVPHV